ncbi:MAG TPA: efflux RND transporter periplasmic adaptor subunit [Candidatus Limnocylindrales bacterium]|nr:efflux RND transporter periplasmic adaptor subunit [Candidatus Limnocylindrales bacterium]
MTRFCRRRRWAVQISYGFALFGAGLILACGKKPETAFERPPAPVTVGTAITQNVPVYIDAVGKIVAREIVSIQPQVSGRITQIHFADGADVKVGQLLFTVDPRPYQAQLNQAEANLAQAEAALSLAKTNFARVENLSDPRAVSRQDYDTKKSAVQSADALVRQNRAAVDNARLNLEYCTIRSPINGRAGQRAVDVGNVVAANSTSLLVIQRLDPVYADFTVTENDLTAVQRNMTQRSLRVEVRLPDDTDDARAGQLTFLDNAVQDGTGTVKLRATLPNADRRFWPGRFAKVRLILDTRVDAVLVPAEAPQLSANGTFLYVVKNDSSAEQRMVKLGQRQGELVVVTEGVKAGEKVVVKGQLGVTPGGKVRIAAPPAVKQDPAAAARSGAKS